MLLLPKGARLIGQGITGAEGSAALPWMLKYGTNIVAGVTPGKGGQKLGDIPIYDSVKEAINGVGQVDGSVMYVPPLFTKKAAFEAIEAGVKFLLIGAEKVPTKDSAELYAMACKEKVNVVGPSSVGLLSPHRKIKIGSIGGSAPDRVFPDGEIAIISKSGGMTSEIGLLLKNNGMGVSWASGIGGDRIIGVDFGDFLLELEKDEKTKASVIFGELGGTYEERVAELVASGKIKKPVVAFVAGEFTMSLPSNVQFGHAGAIIEGDRGRPDKKREVLRKAGVLVAENLDDIPGLIKNG
tara:strand:+ start:293 stop:1183 length:891 start_codon:yes stop_codon:yes gene_type:complete